MRIPPLPFQNRCIAIRRASGAAAIALALASSFMAAAAEPGPEHSVERPPTAAASANQSEVESLKSQVAQQQQQLDALRTALNEQKTILESLLRITAAKGANTASPNSSSASAVTPKPASLGEVASLAPISPAIPAAPQAALDSLASLQPPAAASNAVSQQLAKLSGLLGGIAFSGDFRLRTDIITRSANRVAGPLQNVRERYRLRFNVDKDLFVTERTERALAKVHVQLATEPLNNPNTQDTDFAGFDVRAPISVGEAWVDLNPTRYLSFRGGRGPEIFSETSDADLDRRRGAEGSQFMFDDDVRFNGFNEIVRLYTRKSSFVEFKAGQYILSNPNLQIVPAGSPYIGAGYAAGKRVSSAAFFDQGIVARTVFSARWNQTLTGNFLAYRNANQIAFASTAAGAPLVEYPALGVTLTGALPQLGTGLTTPGGAIYTADGFRIVRGSYQLNYGGWKRGKYNMPLQLWLQASHNTGASFLSNAYFAGVTLGETRTLGDVQLSYRYHYKEANALISEFSDDDVGTVLGANIKTHAIRVDFGINRFLSWENRLYIQDEISRNDPARFFYVPVQRGANTSYRYQGQFLFRF